jgi:predicted ATPase
LNFLREIHLGKEKNIDRRVYPFSIPAVKNLNVLDLDHPVIFLVGENGSGKSTFIEAIAILAGFNPEGGSKNFSFSYHASESSLCDHLKLVRNFRKEKTGFFLRAETLFNVSSQILENDLSLYGWEDLHQKSHGEAFLWLMQNRFGSNGLYFLDEPEAALSPQRQLALLTILHDLVQRGSQFIIATHSPILMAYPKAQIYHLSENGIQKISYEDSEHYQVSREFLANPQRFLYHLLGE